MQIELRFSNGQILPVECFSTLGIGLYTHKMVKHTKTGWEVTDGRHCQWCVIAESGAFVWWGFGTKREAGTFASMVWNQNPNINWMEADPRFDKEARDAIVAVADKLDL